MPQALRCSPAIPSYGRPPLRFSHKRSELTEHRSVGHGRVLPRLCGGETTLIAMLEGVLDRARLGRAQAEEDLFELLAIPSVSALPEHRHDCRLAADWLVERLKGMGMFAE